MIVIIKSIEWTCSIDVTRRAVSAMADNTPTIEQFRPAVLTVLRDGQLRPVGEVRELVANHLNLVSRKPDCWTDPSAVTTRSQTMVVQSKLVV